MLFLFLIFTVLKKYSFFTSVFLITNPSENPELDCYLHVIWKLYISFFKKYDGKVINFVYEYYCKFSPTPIRQLVTLCLEFQLQKVQSWTWTPRVPVLKHSPILTYMCAHTHTHVDRRFSPARLFLNIWWPLPK